MSAIRESKTDDREVHTRLIAQLYCCTEEGMLSDKKLEKLLITHQTVGGNNTTDDLLDG
jgi:hypothetical protein